MPTTLFLLTREPYELRILCIYHQTEAKLRNTIKEHLYAFAHYSGEDCFYINIALGVPSFISKIHFDLVVYHYTFTALKWNSNEHFKQLLKTAKFKRLKNLQGYKIAIPQDEYVNSDAVCYFFKEYGIKTVYTLLRPRDYQKVYPQEKTGLEYYFSIPAGYIDDNAVGKFAKHLLPLEDRKIDVGCRVRKVPYWLGEFGQLKYEIARRFAENQKNSSLKMDISFDAKDVFLEEAWYMFLLSCKIVIGAEAGASVHDPYGEIREKVEAYVKAHPHKDFLNVKQQCFKNEDNSIHNLVMSPRHFECCITKTCQVLVEGTYSDILKPNVHYIPLKKDFSNFDEVIEMIKDVDFCQQVADNAYHDIVASGKYTYSLFVEKVLAHFRKVTSLSQPSQNDKLFVWLLNCYIVLAKILFSIYCKLHSLFVFAFQTWLPENLQATIGSIIYRKKSIQPWPHRK
jgi:hypothetical protein